MNAIFDPQYNFMYKGLHVRIFEIVKQFEGNKPKIINLKLYIDGNYRNEKTFYNTPIGYRRHYNKLMCIIKGVVLKQIGMEGIERKRRKKNVQIQ